MLEGVVTLGIVAALKSQFYVDCMSKGTFPDDGR